MLTAIWLRGGESLAANVQELPVRHLHQVLRGAAQGIVFFQDVVPFPALWDIQAQSHVLNLCHLGEIVVDVGDAVTLGRVERPVSRNQVPVLIVRHKTPWNEVVEVIPIPSKQRILVNTTDGAAYLNDFVPELLLSGQRFPFFRTQQFAGYVRDIGILRLQEQRKISQSKIAKHLIICC